MTEQHCPRTDIVAVTKLSAYVESAAMRSGFEFQPHH